MRADWSQLWADLPPYLSNHLELTVIALSLGIAISLPLAIFVARRPRLRYPVLTAVGLIQTVPGLALLALMVPLLVQTDGLGLGLPAFGFYPALFALTLYSLLPMVRNTVTGLVDVDPALIEAARGVGMTPRQSLIQVEIPLAAPVIIAGLRTATVWVVGIATLATPVGQQCLGNYIFAGLQTRNWPLVLFGVAWAAGLAMLLDLIIGAMQRAAETRSRVLAWVTLSALVLVVGAGLLAPTIASWTRAESPIAVAQGDPSPRAPGAEVGAATDADLGRPVRIGAKTFTEQYILSALLEQTLEQAGLEGERVESLGSTIVFDALTSGDIDVYIDYSGTIWANFMKREDVPAPWRVLAEMDAYLAREHRIRDLGPLGFENAYALAMRRSRAQELGITSIADLARHARNLAMGSDYEFFSRPEWQSLRDGYGLDFATKKTYDPTFMYDAVASGEVDVISAFSSDGRVAAYDLVVLEDPRHVIPPYHAIILLGPTVANRSDVVRALLPLVRAIPLATMQRANHLVDREQDKESPAAAAAWLRSTLDIRPPKRP